MVLVFGFYGLIKGFLLVVAFISAVGPIVLNFTLVKVPSCSSLYLDTLNLLVNDDLNSILG